jgi:hypothetical protein
MIYVSHFSYGLLFTFQVSNPHMKENQTCEREVSTDMTMEVDHWKSLQRLVERNTSSSPPSCELSSWELARVFLTTYKHCSMANALHRIRASQTKHSKFSSNNTARLTIFQLIVCQSAKKL